MLTDPTLEKSIVSCTKYNPSFFQKHHSVIMSRLELTAKEHDMLALLFVHLHKDHFKKIENGLEIKTLVSYQFNSSVLTEWFNVETKHLATTLKPPSDRLSSKKIGIEFKNGDFRYIPLFSEITYKNRLLTITPNPVLIYDFILASSGHARIPIQSFKNLKSEYAKRLFSLLCRFRDEGTVLHKKELNWLHGFFGLLDEKGELTKKTYQKPSVFLKTIIRPAINAISETEKDIEFLIDTTSKEFGFTCTTEGKSISIKFLFKWKTKFGTQEELLPAQSQASLQSKSYEPFDDLQPWQIEQRKQQQKAESAQIWNDLTEKNQSQSTVQQPHKEQTQLEKILLSFKDSLMLYSRSLKERALQNFKDVDFVQSISLKINEISSYIKLVNQNDQSIEHLKKLTDLALELSFVDIASSLQKEIDRYEHSGMLKILNLPKYENFSALEILRLLDDDQKNLLCAVMLDSIAKQNLSAQESEALSSLNFNNVFERAEKILKENEEK